MARVYVSGLRELDAALGEFKKATAKGVLRRVGIRALEPVASAMRAMAPVDPESPGDLAGSVTVGTKLSPRQAKINRKIEGKSFVEVYAGPGPDPAGVQQEFGNVNHAPQPFARPAWDANKGRVLEIVTTDLGAEIEKTARRVRKGR